MKKLQHWLQRKFHPRIGLPVRSHRHTAPALERGSSLSAEDPEELLAQDIAQLDLQRALVHHLEWCVVFNDRLHRANSLLTETEAHLPDAQESGLGQWLAHAARLPIGQNAMFADLCREHERLHELANQVLCHARSGRMDLASTLLNTDFERSRLRVLDSLRELQRR
ncbi:MAG: CZB domain-containing protein [Hydrogenophaga sp.]|nr:CZB domain-containing protein [Hydrogenophaga sp.]